MGVISSIDTWLLRLHQRLVDWSQRPPLWWVEQSGYALGTFALLDAGLRGADHLARDAMAALSLVVNLTFAAAAITSSRRPAFARNLIGGEIFRKIVLAMFLVLAPWLLRANPVGLMERIAFICVLYFWICQPPRPRRRRQAARRTAVA